MKEQERYSRPNKDQTRDPDWTGCVWFPETLASHRCRVTSERRMACIALHRATPRMICLAENDMPLPPSPGRGTEADWARVCNCRKKANMTD